MTNDKTSKRSLRDLLTITKQVGLNSTDGRYLLNLILSSVQPSNSDTKQKEAGFTFAFHFLQELKRVVEPWYVELLPTWFAAHADRSQIVRDQSSAISLLLADIISPHAFREVLDTFLSSLQSEDWRLKVAALQFLKTLSPRVSRQLSPLLPQLIPAISDCICDPKRQVVQLIVSFILIHLFTLLLSLQFPCLQRSRLTLLFSSIRLQVQLAGIEAMNEACKVISNEDIRPCVPQLV